MGVHAKVRTLPSLALLIAAAFPGLGKLRPRLISAHVCYQTPVDRSGFAQGRSRWAEFSRC